MNNKSTELKNNNRLKRFETTMLATQVLILASAFNAYFFGHRITDESQIFSMLGIRIDILILGISALVVVPLVRILSKSNLDKATFYYFCLLSLITAMMAFVEGGLYSVPIMCFPIIAIFSALHTNSKVFFSICAFFCSVVVLMAINHESGWYQGTVSTGAMRMFDLLILVLISAYIAWIVNADSKRLMANLKQDHLQALESKKVIQHLADTDPLTGLANRTFAKTQFEAMQDDMDVSKEEIGLYFVDLDNFKNINDIFDHQIGDELLKNIAKRLSRLIDTKSLVCRLGGDEFLLCIKVRKPFNYEMLAKEILISLSEPHIIFGTQAEVTASIGITVIEDKLISFDNARKQADMAMYKSKQAGKNDFFYYSKDLHRDYMRNLNILNSLKDALSQNLFDLHYQPKIEIGSNQVIGAEALLRWTRENPDNLSPGEFIPVVESTELIHSIGAWVIEEACLTCQKWHLDGHEISIAVNVSALQLARAGFYEMVVEALKVSGLKAQYLEIELTEHFLVQENQIIQSQLKSLKKLGVTLAIDDFGTGYSNMGYLTHMDIDTLKLDRSFISGIDKAPTALAIVKAINEMAVVLGIQVVAEGVEEQEERLLLKEMGCSIGQGYLWSKPLPSNSLIKYLENQKPIIVNINPNHLPELEETPQHW